MIGSLMVYGHQQYRDLVALDMDELFYAYRCVALVKKRENEATEEQRKKLEAEAEEKRRSRERGWGT